MAATAVAWVAAVLAALSTGLWAIQLSQSRGAFDQVRYALVGAGILSAVSLAVAPPCSGPSELSAGLALLLAGYQFLMWIAVSRGGAVMQAVINCNVVVVCLHRHFFVEPAERPGALIAAVAAAASSAALLSACRF